MLRKILLSAFAFALLAVSARARTTDTGKPVKPVFDADLTGSSNVTWYPDTVYELKQFVFLESGGKLTILPGTIVKGDTGTQANAKALIICRGAKIDARGTKANPIIFTSLLDTVDSQTDLLVDDRGLWGGVITLGQARISDGKFEEAIEGIPLVGGLPDPRALYGGIGGDTTTFNDDDSSGVLKFVSIRHGGSVLEANNEINGLTLGGVGRKTVFDYIDVFGNADDDIEFFGGVPQMKHVVASYSDDDGFDTDEGYRGKVQFGFRLMSDFVGNHGTENDGAENPITTLPFTEQHWANLTIIGSGLGAPNTLNDRAFIFRDNASPHIRNSIFTDFTERIGDITNTNTLTSLDTSLILRDNIWWKFGCNGGGPGALSNAACVAGTGPRNAALLDYLNSTGGWATNPSNNQEVDPQLVSYSRPHVYNAHTLDPRPQVGSPAAGGNPDPSVTEGDPFYNSVDFIGAFSSDSTTENGTWLCGWTALAQYGFLKQIRGDLNGDGNFTPADAVGELQAVYLAIPFHRCRSDLNCDGVLTPTDAVLELQRVYLAIPTPCV